MTYPSDVLDAQGEEIKNLLPAVKLRGELPLIFSGRTFHL